MVAFLIIGGLIMPNRFTMHLVGVADVKRYGESVEFWKNVYGYKMSCMKKVIIFSRISFVFKRLKKFKEMID